MFSYWEHKTFFPRRGVVIAGAGITGLSAALHLKALKPGLTITVAEAGIPPGGATTRNAGFACIGSLSEWLEDARIGRPEPVFELGFKRWQGLQALLQALSDENIGYQAAGNYEIFFPEEKDLAETCLNFMEVANQWFKEKGFGSDVFSIAPPPAGLPSDSIYIFNKLEGVLDSGRLYLSLRQRCEEEGIMILNGLKVIGFQEVGDGVNVVFEQHGDILTSAFALCTNAFAGILAPYLDVKPARGIVLVSEPLNEFLSITPSGFHHHHGYNYFRFLDGRLLVGGGRHLQVEREYTLDPNVPPDLKDYLRHLAYRITGKPLKFDYAWTGFMGKGTDKNPIVKALGDRTFCAVRLGGMGVALGYGVAGELANLIASRVD